MKNRLALLKILALCSFSLVSGCMSREASVHAPAQSSPSTLSNMNGSETRLGAPSKLLLRGRIDCKTNEVLVDAGMFGKQRFQHLNEISSALEEKEYDGSIFDELEKIKVCDLSRGDSETGTYAQEQPLLERISEPALLLEAELDKLSIPFSLSEVTFEGYKSLTSYLEETKGKQGCKPISEKCMKCDKKIYCQGGRLTSAR